MRASFLLMSAGALCACSKAPAAASDVATVSSGAGTASSSTKPHGLATMASGGDAPVDKLIAQLEQRVAHLPKVDNWVKLGQAWVQKARETADPVYYLNADACAAEALAIDPRSAMATELRVLLELSNHQFAQARDLAETTLAQKPDQVLMLGLLSDALTDLGDYDGAQRRLQQMMDLKPSLPSYSRASYLQWLRGDEDGALQSARLAFDSSDPKEPEAVAWVLVQAATIFWQRGDYAGAEAGYDKALQTFPDFPPALVGRGRVALAGGEPKRAAELLTHAFQQSRLVSTAWLVDDARTAAGDAAGAAEIQAFLTKNGPSTDPRTYAQYLAAHDRDHDLASALAEAERKTRDDLYTEDTLAWALYRQGKLAPARAASDKAMILGTPDATLWYHAGAIRLAQGQAAEGLTLVRKALARNPHFDETGRREALALVAAHGR